MTSCSGMRAPWQLLGPTPPHPSSPTIWKNKVMCERERESEGRGTERQRVGWSVMDGTGVFARAYGRGLVFWAEHKTIRARSGPDRVRPVLGSARLPAVLGLTHLQWPPEIKNINILMPKQRALTTAVDDMNEHENLPKKKKRQHLTIFFTSWHCIFFFFFLLISYKISLDWYTLILLLTT